MQAQLITYQLRDISQADYLKQMVEPDAPVLASVPGLISKVWLADEETNSFGGFYLWENQDGHGSLHAFRPGQSSSQPTVRQERFVG